MKRNKGRLDFNRGVLYAISFMAICILISICFAEKLEPNTASIVGGALSAIATVFLGLIAIWQNTRYKRLADETNDIRIRPEFFAVYNDLEQSELCDLPLVSAKPIRWTLSKTAYEELLCLCKVVDFPVVRISPYSLCYFRDEQLQAEFYEFDGQNEPNQIFEKGNKFRIYIPIVTPLCDAELVLKYENIYGDCYTKKIKFQTPPIFKVPEASVFGTYASGQVIMEPASNVRFTNH